MDSNWRQAVFPSVQFSSSLGGAQLIASQRCAGFGVNSRNRLPADAQPLPPESPSHRAPRVITEQQASSPALRRSFPLATSHLVVNTPTPLFYSSRRAGERLRAVAGQALKSVLTAGSPQRTSPPRAWAEPRAAGGRPGPAPPRGGAPASSRSSARGFALLPASRPDAASSEPTRLSPFDELRQAGHVRKFLGVRFNRA